MITSQGHRTKNYHPKKNTNIFDMRRKKSLKCEQINSVWDFENSLCSDSVNKDSNDITTGSHCEFQLKVFASSFFPAKGESLIFKGLLSCFPAVN